MQIRCMQIHLSKRAYHSAFGFEKLEFSIGIDCKQSIGNIDVYVPLVPESYDLYADAEFAGHAVNLSFWV